MNRRMPLLPYTRFSRVSPAHYTRKGRFTPPFVIVLQARLHGACGGLIMDALRACIFALCPLRIGTSRAHSSGFGDRIRQAVHEFSRGQLHATASAFALPRDRQESRFARLPHLFNDCLVIPFSRRFRAVRKHPEGSAPLAFAPPSSCGH